MRYLTTTQKNSSDYLGALSIEVIFNFVKETFVGEKAPTVKATFMSRETQEEKYLTVTYEGPLDGLKNIAPAFFKAIKHED
jgi:hypothetical protein